MIDLEFLLEEDLVIELESNMFGDIHINKYKLINESYIKDLIEKIEKLPSDSEKEKYYKLAIKYIDEFINAANSVDHRYSRMPEHTKSTMMKEIKIYENNKKLLIQSMNKNSKSSYYQNGFIKIGTGYWFAWAATNINSDKNYGLIQKDIKEWNKTDYNNFGKISFDGAIEEIAFAKYDMSKMMKYLEYNKGNANDIVDDIENSSMLRVLKGKTLTQIIYMDSDIIVYCHEDNCCYIFSAKYQDSIDKVSLSQIINAANIAYRDLQKMIKEYK